MFDLASIFQRARQRRVIDDLMKFDDHLLRDIGLTRGDLARMRAARRTPRDHE